MEQLFYWITAEVLRPSLLQHIILYEMDNGCACLRCGRVHKFRLFPYKSARMSFNQEVFFILCVFIYWWECVMSAVRVYVHV